MTWLGNLKKKSSNITLVFAEFSQTLHYEPIKYNSKVTTVKPLLNFVLIKYPGGNYIYL